MATKDDLFILASVFPDPEAILSVQVPTTSALVHDCIFVLDANSLLAAYDIGTAGVHDITKIYRGLAENDRLYVPIQALREFIKNRTNKLKDVYSLVNTLDSSIPKVPAFHCPMLEHLQPYQDLAQGISELTAQLSKYKRNVKALLQQLHEWNWSDPITAVYRSVFSGGRVVSHSVKEEELVTDWERRKSNAIPPGYKDRGIGDLIIWHTILELGRNKDTNVVFVSNDEKADWMVRTNDTTLCARYELVEEFRRATKCLFSVVGFADFLALMGASKQTVNEAEAATIGRYMRIDKRLLAILDELYVTISRFVEGYDEEEYYYFGTDVDALVEAFRTAMRHVWAGANRPMPEMQSYIGISELLEQIITQVNVVRFLTARMKESGEEETKALLTFCVQFCDAYSALDSWRHNRKGFVAGAAQFNVVAEAKATVEPPAVHTSRTISVGPVESKTSVAVDDTQGRDTPPT